MAPIRLESARIAALVVSRAIGATTSQRAIGAALDISHTAVARWADGEAPAAFTIRDLIATHERGEAAFAVRVIDELRALFAESVERPAPPSLVACAISEAAGMIAGLARRIEEDGRVTAAEEAELLGAIRAAEAVITGARRAREARK